MNLEHLTHDHELKNPEKPSLKETGNKFNLDKRIPELKEIAKPRIDIHSPKIRLYLHEVQKTGDYKIPKVHMKELKEYLASHDIERIDPSDTFQNHKDFNNHKKQLIEKWESETGKTWPRYDHDVIGSNGTVIAKKGQLFDAHHIIEVSYGGPNESWNIMPVSKEKHIEIHQNNSTREVFS